MLCRFFLLFSGFRSVHLLLRALLSRFFFCSIFLGFSAIFSLLLKQRGAFEWKWKYRQLDSYSIFALDFISAILIHYYSIKLTLRKSTHFVWKFDSNKIDPNDWIQSKSTIQFNRTRRNRMTFANLPVFRFFCVFFKLSISNAKRFLCCQTMFGYLLCYCIDCPLPPWWQWTSVVNIRNSRKKKLREKNCNQIYVFFN